MWKWLWEVGSGYTDERIVMASACKISGQTFDELSVVGVFNASWRGENDIEDGILLTDDAFMRDQVPMTRAEVRWCILGKLGLKKRRHLGVLVRIPTSDR